MTIFELFDYQINKKILTVKILTNKSDSKRFTYFVKMLIYKTLT